MTDFSQTMKLHRLRINQSFTNLRSNLGGAAFRRVELGLSVDCNGKPMYINLNDFVMFRHSCGRQAAGMDK